MILSNTVFGNDILGLQRGLGALYSPKSLYIDPRLGLWVHTWLEPHFKPRIKTPDRKPSKQATDKTKAIDNTAKAKAIDKTTDKAKAVDKTTDKIDEASGDAKEKVDLDLRSCDECSLSFRGERGLRRHMNMTHFTPTNKYQQGANPF
ncbi:hypothetical protein MSG28_015905 [Choristoneura fumiferana]|uniref:Uncharacterized protein n=1 Tax=Choristoneura fumiferana TaxID=7141 RepID=A0ACC0K523_CHOFU|nr:hypothetical protein MSG28_015905 [Choristoneura fumiferana]